MKKYNRLMQKIICLLVLSFVFLPNISLAHNWLADCGFAPKANRIIVPIKAFIRSDRTQSEASSAKINVNIPAGAYHIWLASSDGYSGRASANQLNEQYFLKLYSGHSLISQTNSISDLDNDVDYAYLEEKVNSFFKINKNVSSIVAFHSVYPSNSANSLSAVCAAFDRISLPTVITKPAIYTY